MSYVVHVVGMNDIPTCVSFPRMSCDLNSSVMLTRRVNGLCVFPYVLVLTEFKAN